MDKLALRFQGAIVISFILAFALTVLPLKESWVIWRPEWLALTIIHWGFVSPHKSSFVLTWFFGLLLDALHGSILGQHAFGFTIILFMTLKMRPRVLIDSFFQQIFIIAIVLGTYLLVNLWILGITGNSPSGWGYWLTIISSLVVWPFYHYSLHIFHAIKKPFD